MTPSGYIGEPGERGEIGECSTGAGCGLAGGLREDELKIGELGGRLAFRGGSKKSYTAS